jgi:uncharacterized DUF497 family protein
MLVLDHIVGFEWDHGNARKNEKHGVSQSESEQVFFDPQLLVVADANHSVREPRYHALGMTFAGRHLHVTFTLRDRTTRIRIISARPMHRKERRFYEQQS